MEDTKTNSAARGVRMITRGESAVAGVGLLVGGVLLLCVGLAGWWTLYTNQRTRQEARAEQVRTAAQMLSMNVERLFAAGELSALRAQVTGVAAGQNLAGVRVRLPSGMIVAESDRPAGSAYPPVPETWSAPADLVDFERTEKGGREVVGRVVTVRGRGPLLVEVEDARRFPLMGDASAQAGVGAVAAVGMVLLLASYRIARRRFRAIGAISEALAASAQGEVASEALVVSEEFGPEASAWNRIILESQDLKRRVGRERQAAMSHAGRGRESDLASLCDAMWQGLVMVDEQLRVKYLNGAGSVFLGVKREEASGKSVGGFIPDTKVLDALRAVTMNGQRTRTVVEVERPGEGGAGTVLRFTIRPVRKEDNAAAIVVIEDVTQQRVAEDSRRLFVASATHELRTPLTNVRLYVDSLLEDPDQDAGKRATALNVVSQEVRRLERMVSDMLSVSQIEAGTLKLQAGDVRLEPVFQELADDFMEQARQKEIKLKFDLPPKWPQLSGDRDKIVMALNNLVGNAIKYTPAGGEVTVRVRDENGRLLVDVVDNGIGIKEDEQPMVFERFYRAKDRRIANITGTGLGLSIAREVVRLHGGDITLQSQVDKGSTFTMTLPARAA